MLISVIQVGNSRGIRFPKIILDKFAVKDKLNMEVTDNEIILTPIKEPSRKGWAEAFLTMHKNKDDILEPIPDSREVEWEW
ncbi:AbrB/MazE/SpoVT family DNA-binding domain-containing protein [Treponema vincentii]|uniref:AbrB/MazE/SpoVT family DNA-binding domain-containing protein n=1 Tax=Treponema vincentii TaxID=69710 RepID=UPI0020A3D2B8|nr:AbrB/MazE/SpoVT family DNA-binding domain-containing protein [Treponema vincentii]UTC46454.1 AbrB/MazE/SpoVT family DNA-binding domain-containing protein [Treponema vincentii]